MDVRAIQTELARLGFNLGAIDGKNGPKTKAAIRAFQKARGLVVDGIVGPKTIAAFKPAAPKATTPAPVAATGGRKSTNWIAIHCSATRPAMDIGAKEIRQWHKAQGWADIGYHFVIRRDGKVETGRAVSAIGAHVAGYNSTSVGVCMVGGVNQNDYTKAENNFTPAQWASLTKVVTDLVKRYPGARVRGHRDFPKVAKACPSFDAIAWAKKGKFPT